MTRTYNEDEWTTPKEVEWVDPYEERMRWAQCEREMIAQEERAQREEREQEVLTDDEERARKRDIADWVRWKREKAAAERRGPIDPEVLAEAQAELIAGCKGMDYLTFVSKLADKASQKTQAKRRAARVKIREERREAKDKEIAKRKRVRLTKQAKVLQLHETHPDWSVRQLADEANVSKSGVHRILAR